jgi:xanthine/uracil permease
MIRALVSLAVTLLVAVLIWFGLGVVAPDIYVEKAFVWIVYPSIATGIITALVLRLRGRRS